MDKSKVDRICSALKIVVEEANKLGYFGENVSVRVESASYSPSGELHTRITFADINPDGTVVTDEMASLRANHRFLQLTESDLDATYTFDGLGEITLAGYNKRAPKYKYWVKQLETGKIFTLSVRGWNTIINQARSRRGQPPVMPYTVKTTSEDISQDDTSES